MRAYNFSAGPAALPTSVLEEVQRDLLDWRGTGCSVMEISHRSHDFLNYVLEPARNNFKKLLMIPDNYHVLFISMGTSHQFSMVPLNVLNRSKNKSACYVNTGIWSGKAIKEARRFIPNENMRELNLEGIKANCFDPDLSYVHYTPNETIEGLQIHDVPDTGEIPLIADMSSEILSKPIDIAKYGLIYAGAQKNMGPSGLTLAIIRDDLLDYAPENTPALYRYKTYSENQSLYNTPNTFAIYLAGLMFKWIIEKGSLDEMQKMNRQKSQLLYGYIDSTEFYRAPMESQYRSDMNIVFYLPKPELESVFMTEAAKNNLLYLKGHKAVGGLRASIYNAMPQEGVEALIAFMTDFEKRYG